jgi:hypothetical protein
LKNENEEERIMKNIRETLSLVLMAVIAVFLLQAQVWGAAGEENQYELNPNAAGTKYSGPLTVYFECVLNENTGQCSDEVSHVYFFVRLNQGMRYNIYSYDAGELQNGYDYWVPAFHTFIEKRFIPDICTADCPTFADGRVALKSVTNNIPLQNGVDPSCFIADIVIAVQQ